MIMPWSKWDTRFMDRAKEIAYWSKDPDHKVGAIIADGLHHVIGEGYNGPPMFVNDDIEDENERRMRTLHAELNAILHANKADLSKCTIYIYPYAPCALCAAALIQKQIGEVIYYRRSQLSSWSESQRIGAQMLSEAGILMQAYLPET